jgi:GT2 family glycosyltransferase
VSDLGITLFAVPKAFVGHIRTIQLNALASWGACPLVKQIILIGNEPGVAEAAVMHSATHVENVACDDLGTPQVDDAFRIAERNAEQDWLCYANADIILMPEFWSTIEVATKLKECLIVSRRWNMQVAELVEFGSGWSDALRKRADRGASLFTEWGIDVFVFPRHFLTSIPAFSIGRPYWDNWMITRARRKGMPVLDATVPYGVIHQEHTYDGLTFGDPARIRRSQQALKNFWLAGDSLYGLSHIGNATHEVREGRVTLKKQRTVSIVIPHAGTYQQLRGCLASLVQQTYPRTLYDIIVVENSDRTESSQALIEFPFVRVTREAKRGPAAARNKGAAIAEGHLIAFLDSDIRPAGDWLEKAVSASERYNDGCVVACNIVPWHATGTMTSVGCYEALAYHDQRGYVHYSDACITGAIVVPRALWYSIGPFDEDFPDAACEDWEWSTRATSRGVRIQYADNAVVRHPVRTRWRDLRVKAERLARGEILLLWKRGRYPLLDFEIQASICSARFRAEFRRIFESPDLTLRLKIGATLAAALVWLWTRIGVRQSLESPPATVMQKPLFSSDAR